MATQLFSNNASSELSGALAQAGTTAVLSAGTGARFPAPVAPDYFIATIFEKDDAGNEINIEIVKVTARTADTLTIERDFESVAGVAGGYSYPSAVGKTAYIDLRWTAFAASNGLQASANLSDLGDIPAAKETLNLENVDNTPDADKPISSAQALALEAKQDSNKKDTSGGFAGLTLLKLNLKNAAGSVLSWLTSAATSARTWTFPDKDGTVAMLSDITGTNSGVNTGDQTLPTLGSLGAQATSAKDATGGYVGLTLFKINFKNAADTFTSWLVNANTAARTYTFRDRNGTIADDTDLALKANLADPVFSGKVGIGFTPNAATETALQVHPYKGIQAGSYSSNLGYYNGAWRSPCNCVNAGFMLYSGANVGIVVAPPNSGAADAVVSAVTAMQIDNNGRVGFGTAPTYSVHVYRSTPGSETWIGVENPSTNANSAAGVLLYASGGGSTAHSMLSMSKEGSLNLANAFAGGAINMYSTNWGMYTNGATPAIWADAGQNVGVPGTLVLSQYTKKTFYPAAGTAFTVSLANGSIQRFTTSGNITITLPASVAGKSAIIEILYGGAHTVTFAGGTAIKYPNGVAPTASSTAGKIDRYCIEQDGLATLISDAGRKF